MKKCRYAKFFARCLRLHAQNAKSRGCLIRSVAAESATAAAEALDEPLGTGWVLPMALVSVWRSVLSSPWAWQ
jgi:hypothetical protein